MQEVFLFIFRKAGLFDPSQGTARSWIIQVTYHRAIDRRHYLMSRRYYAFDDVEASAHEPIDSRREILPWERRGRLRACWKDGGRRATSSSVCGPASDDRVAFLREVHTGRDRGAKGSIALERPPSLLPWAREAAEVRARAKTAAKVKRMGENGSHPGVRALSTDQSHEHFAELHALSTSGALTAEEWQQLREHLAGCAECRETKRQYEALIAHTSPAWLPMSKPAISPKAGFLVARGSRSSQ